MLKRSIYQHSSHRWWQHPAISYPPPLMNTDTVFLIVLTFFSTSNLDDFFIYEQEEKTKKHKLLSGRIQRVCDHYFSRKGRER